MRKTTFIQLLVLIVVGTACVYVTAARPLNLADQVGWGVGINALPQVDYVTVDGNMQSFEELIGSALFLELRDVAIYPDSVGIFFNDGNVAITDAPLPSGSIVLDVTKEGADTLKFITDGNAVNMVVIQTR